ncbi:Non-structural maintenance of chromosomes element 1-like protein [Entamoeba marina]
MEIGGSDQRDFYSDNSQHENEENTNNGDSTETNEFQKFVRLFYIKKIISETELNEFIDASQSKPRINTLLRNLCVILEPYSISIKKSINQSDGKIYYCLVTLEIDDMNNCSCIFNQQQLDERKEIIELLKSNEWKLAKSEIQQSTLFDTYSIMSSMGYFVECGNDVTLGPLALVSPEFGEDNFSECGMCKLKGTICFYPP